MYPDQAAGYIAEANAKKVSTSRVSVQATARPARGWWPNLLVATETCCASRPSLAGGYREQARIANIPRGKSCDRTESGVQWRGHCTSLPARLQGDRSAQDISYALQWPSLPSLSLLSSYYFSLLDRGVVSCQTSDSALSLRRYITNKYNKNRTSSQKLVANLVTLKFIDLAGIWTMNHSKCTKLWKLQEEYLDIDSFSLWNSPMWLVDSLPSTRLDNTSHCPHWLSLLKGTLWKRTLTIVGGRCPLDQLSQCRPPMPSPTPPPSPRACPME